MSFSHVFLTRPQPQSGELANLLRPLGLEVVNQTAFSFRAVDPHTELHDYMAEAMKSGAD